MDTSPPLPQAPVDDEPPTSAEIVEATRNLWEIFALTNEWIKNSDTKAAAVLSANAILADATVQTFGHIEGFDQSFLRKHPVVLGLDLVVLALAVASVAFCLHCIAPKMRFGGRDTAKSLIFFGHIAQRASAREYEVEVYRTLTDEQKAMNQISDQVWINSRIVTAKLWAVLWAVRLFAAALLFALAAALVGKFV